MGFKTQTRRLLRHSQRLMRPTSLWVFAVVIGVASAYAIIGFRIAIDAVSLLTFGATETSIASGAASLSPWRAWIIPVIGGFAVSGLLYISDRFGWLPEGRAQGVAEVIEARAIRDGRISLSTGLASAAVSAVSLGAGASAGREGPAVHLGAALASAIDSKFGFTAKDRRTLLGCGAAAAVAASFNAPIAGVLFSLEVVMGVYALSVFGPIAAASVAAVLVTRTYLGDFPAFAAPAYGEVTTVDAPLAAVLGVLCGFVAALFFLMTSRFTIFVRNFADRKKLPYIFLPPFGGIFLGTLGAFYPEILGVSYEAVTNALKGSYGLQALLIIAVLKILATAVTASCRFGGGVFSPGLVIGALVGAAFGAVVAEIEPLNAANPALYAMVGMGAGGGAIIGAPISTTLIVFELTGDYALTVSLMVAVALATLVMQGFTGKSFFQWQLSRRGYDLSDGPQGVILKTIRVLTVMEEMPPGQTLPEGAPRIMRDQALGEALALLDQQEDPGLPVVRASAPDEVIGYLTRERALRAYNRALIDSHVEHHR